MKDLIGKRFGKLKVIDQKREKNRTWLYCRCDCENKKWIRADSLTNGRVVSCGCYNKEVNFKKPVDITNRRFNRLVALKPTNNRDKYNGSVIWECKCSCGNISYVAEYKLKNGVVGSCGCLGKENSKKNMKKATGKHLKEHIVEGTNIHAIIRKEPNSNNTSGVTGVQWDKNRNKWRATITFKGKVYFLGRYKNKEDAIKVRKEAEENIFGEFLEWYKEEYKKEQRNE